MKKNKNSGTAIIEFNHSGIPDSKLKPEPFNERQEAILSALSADHQRKIRSGCPVAVIDLGTGETLAEFNRQNVVISELDAKLFAHSILESMQKYFKDPENEKKYLEWKRQNK